MEAFRFAGFDLEPGERRLSRGGQNISLTPKAFELLVLLVRNAGHVIGKDELMAALWPDQFVAESNLTKHVWLLRRILDEGADGDGCIQTVSKVGYRFVAPLARTEVVGSGPPAPDVAAAAVADPSPPAAALAGVRASFAWSRSVWAVGAFAALVVIVVPVTFFAYRPRAAFSADRSGAAVSLLSFENLSRNSRDAWISSALAETLGAEVALAGRLRIVPDELARAAQSGLPAPGAGGYAPANLRLLRRRLGADYVLSGGYLVSGDGEEAALRLDIALQDTRTGAVITLSRTGSVAELPALVTLIGADLRKDLGGASDPVGDMKLAVNMQAPTAEVMRHIGYGLDALRRYDPARARDELLEAVAQGPAYAPAYAYLAQAWSALGYKTKARAAAEQAAAYAADLPPPMRLQILAQRQLAQFDWAGAAQTLGRLVVDRPGDPEYRLQLIDTLVTAGKPDDASRGLDALRALPRRGPHDPRIELAAARIAAARDDSKGRAEHAAKALADARANDETGLAADAEVQLALALPGGRRETAVDTLRQARADYRRMGNPHGEAWAWQNLGNLLADHDPPQARKAYELALAQYQRIGDLAGVAAIYSNLAAMLWNSGDRDAAETAVKHVLEIRRETDDPVGQAWALAALAISESDESASDAVVAGLRQAISLDLAAGAQSHRGFSLLSLSEVLRTRGDLAEAQKICAESQAVYAAIGDPSVHHQADLQCAQIALDRGDLDAAEAGLEAARKTAQQSGDVMTLGNADLTQGQIALGEGRASEAASRLEAARRRFAAADMITGEAVACALAALADAALNKPAARDAAAACARNLRGRINERQEVIAADIAAAQLRGENGDHEHAAAALEAIAADADKRRWVGWALEARLADLDVLSRAGETARARSLRLELAASARRDGFGWVSRRLSQAGSVGRS